MEVQLEFDRKREIVERILDAGWCRSLMVIEKGEMTSILFEVKVLVLIHH